MMSFPASDQRWLLLWLPASLIRRLFRSGTGLLSLGRFRPKTESSSSAGKEKLGSISKQGDRYLRSLFTTGALAVIRYAKIYGTKASALAHRSLLARRPTKVAAIALANKIARMAWAMMAKGEALSKNQPHLRRKPDRADHPA